MLWIALHLPLLSLESFAATLAASGDERGAERPIALLEAHRIVSANAAALSLGVKPGLKRATGTVWPCVRCYWMSSTCGTVWSPL